MQITLYVCPTPGCGDYYGYKGMPDLNVPAPPRTEDRHAIQREMGGQPFRHTRANCPSCRARGLSVERELVSISLPDGWAQREPDDELRRYRDEVKAATGAGPEE